MIITTAIRLSASTLIIVASVGPRFPTDSPHGRTAYNRCAEICPVLSNLLPKGCAAPSGFEAHNSASGQADGVDHAVVGQRGGGDAVLGKGLRGTWLSTIGVVIRGWAVTCRA